VITCLWYSVLGTRQVQVVLIRDRSTTGYDLALVTTDLNATAAHVIERYASRWSIEVAIEDAKQVYGTGQARNRTARAVERTVPFMLACQALAYCWYATDGHDPADVTSHRARSLGTPPRPALHRRHGRQAPPRYHRRPFSPISPRPANTRRNTPHPPGLGRPRRITAKVEPEASCGLLSALAL
jgi:hypothetical protein